MRNIFTLSRVCTSIFFIGFLLGGLLLVDDYGISWDESTQLEIGRANYRYIVKGDPALLDLRDRYYGPLFEIFLVRVMDQSSSRAMYLSRHVWTFLSFYAGVAAFFALARSIHKNTWLALIGTMMLAISPRIFADAFYNSKDIPFLSAAIFSSLSLLWYLRKPGWPRLLLHAVFSAAFIAVRMAGMYMPALTVGMLLIEVISHRLAPGRAVRDGLAYVLLTGVFGLLFYPVLWSNPLPGLKEALQAVTNFPHYTPVLFMGQFISPQELPWFYLPVWIGITTPLAYLVLFLLGSSVVIWGMIRHFNSFLSPTFRERLLALAWFFGPMTAVIILHPTLYDGWRQMFFLYPGLVLLALEGCAWLFGRLSGVSVRIRSGAVMAGVLLLIVPVIYQMVIIHPYQNVYFNRLAGKDMQTIKQNYDLDYWGLSYREGLAYILRVDARDAISVYADTPAGERSVAIMGKDAEERLHFTDDLTTADYFLGNYRWHPDDYPLSNEIYSVRVGDAKILSVFQMK